MSSDKNKTINYEDIKGNEEISGSILKSLNENTINKVVNADIFSTDLFRIEGKFDLIFLDPPYNLNKTFKTLKFKQLKNSEYAIYMSNILQICKDLLKEDGCIYICSDWKTSKVMYSVIPDYFHIMNRITWDRKKGVRALKNWKNNHEDIFYCVKDPKNYYFNPEFVLTRKKVISPYRNEDNSARDWEEDADGNKYRFTHPSNLWTDLNIPFWSMDENTEHPTQKPEKMLAKILLSSCPMGGTVLDPMCGSGTTLAVAKKLGYNYVGVESNYEYACISQYRTMLAEHDRRIQGYESGYFLE